MTNPQAFLVKAEALHLTTSLDVKRKAAEHDLIKRLSHKETQNHRTIIFQI